MVGLRIKPRASCMLGKYFTRWATTLGQKPANLILKLYQAWFYYKKQEYYISIDSVNLCLMKDQTGTIVNIKKKKKKRQKQEKLFPWLRISKATLAKDWSLICSIYVRQLTTTYNSNCRGPNISGYKLHKLVTSHIHILTHACTHMHTQNLK